MEIVTAIILGYLFNIVILAIILFIVLVKLNKNEKTFYYIISKIDELKKKTILAKQYKVYVKPQKNYIPYLPFGFGLYILLNTIIKVLTPQKIEDIILKEIESIHKELDKMLEGVQK